MFAVILPNGCHVEAKRIGAYLKGAVEKALYESTEVSDMAYDVLSNVDFARDGLVDANRSWEYIVFNTPYVFEEIEFWDYEDIDVYGYYELADGKTGILVFTLDSVSAEDWTKMLDNGVLDLRHAKPLDAGIAWKEAMLSDAERSGDINTLLTEMVTPYALTLEEITF